MVLTMDETVENEFLDRALALMAKKELDAAELELDAGLKDAEAKKDKVLTALFYSTLGVLYKMKKDFSKSWKFYEKAEKTLPEDSSLKLISARLLIDVFGQFDAAIHRCQRVIQASKSDPTMAHQAYGTMGLAYLRKAEKSQTVDCLENAMREDFAGISTAANIDLKLLEAMIRKKVGLEACKSYLERALKFAEAKQEENFAELFRRLLEAFPKDE